MFRQTVDNVNPSIRCSCRRASGKASITIVFNMKAPTPAVVKAAKPAKKAKPTAPEPSLELRDACIEAARDVIAERGLEHLSLREVARKLGVSHQAPYKHYPSRDHLLAEVIRRCLQGFAAFLDARPLHEDPRQDLESLGFQYLAYARENPLEYRLMFSTAWPEPAVQPELIADAVHAYEILRGVLRRMHGDSPEVQDKVELDAVYVWSAVHGLAGVMSGPLIGQLGLTKRVLQQAVAHAMTRGGMGLAGDL
jgi:AcrR family transcriptional regulator